MLLPREAYVIEANPAIIPASGITANLYFCLWLCGYKFNVNSFYNIILSDRKDMLI